MKPRHFAVGLILLSFTLLACTLAGSAAPSEKPAPTLPGTSTEATLPPLAPGTLIPTRIPPTPNSGDHDHPQRHADGDGDPRPHRNTSPGLEWAVGFHHQPHRLSPDATREGGVILTMRFDATGGNGVYTYYRENQRTTRTYERPATKGTAVIDSYRVESGDGQSVEKKERFTGSQFGCP